MKKIFTDRESKAIMFLALAFAFGLAANQIKDLMADQQLEESIPAMNAKIEQFEKEAKIFNEQIESSFVGVTLTSDDKLESVNVNVAKSNGLELLPGIGPKLALRIIEYRKENGPFKTDADIRKVSGIGESKLNNIRNLIVYDNNTDK